MARRPPRERPGMTARDEVLARIDAALAAGGAGSGGPVPVSYRTCGDVSGLQLLDLLADRLTDYRALVRRATPVTLATEVSAALSERGARRLVVPPGLAIELPGWAEVSVDDGLTPAELD